MFIHDRHRQPEQGCKLRLGATELVCACNPGHADQVHREATGVTAHSEMLGSYNAMYGTPQEKPSGMSDHSTEAGDDNCSEHSVGIERMSWQRIWGSSGDHPLIAALRLHCAHVVPFQQELRKYAANLGDLRDLNEPGVDHLRRLVVQHADALGSKAIEANDEWLVHERMEDFGIQYGAKLVDDMFQWFRIVEMQGCDLLKGFAAFLEVDLTKSFADDLICAEPLGMHTAKRDAAWRTVACTKPYYVKEDNVWVYSPMNALDEALGALVIFAYTPPKLRLAGVPYVPQPETGFVRSEFDCTIYVLEPIYDETVDIPDVPTGFRLTEMGVSRPSAAIWSDSSATVAMQCIKDGTADSTQFPRKLKRYLDLSIHLENRMRFSPRAALYERIRKRCNTACPSTVSV
mmetsp:Transcript_6086/g.11202  ORF Transcript_6086/g.11202 Transcript_6086/m.11202 type:complete len:403 (-) Transcript_6086:55-1263(-)